MIYIRGRETKVKITQTCATQQYFSLIPHDTKFVQIGQAGGAVRNNLGSTHLPLKRYQVSTPLKYFHDYFIKMSNRWLKFAANSEIRAFNPVLEKLTTIFIKR